MNRERYIFQGRQGAITLLHFRCEARRSDPILIVPNGYGCLAYAKALAEDFSRVRGDAFIPILAGQGGNQGVLSISEAASDLASLIAQAKEKTGGKSLTLLPHCSSMLYILHWPEGSTVWSAVSKVLLYSYLSRPEAHLERFRNNARRYKVRLANDLGCMQVDLESYAALPRPFGVVHPKTTMNRLRASEQDLEALRKKANPIVCLTPRDGYEILDRPQEQRVNQTVRRSLLPALHAMSQQGGSGV